jgi:transitional endoplasmic reticulum ATPase
VDLPKGVLIYGESGCGKTSLSIAISNKSKSEGLVSSVLMLDASQIVSKVVGQSESRLRQVFQECRRLSPCILIIDQIEVIAASRENSRSNSMDRTLSTLLIELDGTSADSESSSLILVCTTRNPKLLDPAILRPGRLDVHVQIPPLSLESRKSILSRLSQGNLCDSYIEEISSQTKGYTPAQIKLLHRSACMIALRESISLSFTNQNHWNQALNQFQFQSQ